MITTTAKTKKTRPRLKHKLVATTDSNKNKAFIKLGKDLFDTAFYL